MIYHRKFQPDWTINGLVMAKKRSPIIYEIIVILRNILTQNLAKYYNFSMRPSLLIMTIKLHILNYYF